MNALEKVLEELFEPSEHVKGGDGVEGCGSRKQECLTVRHKQENFRD